MRNKKTIILGSIAIALVAIIGILSALYIFLPANIKAPDFTNKTLSDVETWLNENKIKEDAYKIDHEFSESIEKDYVIKQSVLPDEDIKKNEVFTVTISDGKDPDYKVLIPDFTNKTHDEIDKWFKENLFTNYQFEFVQSDNTDKDKYVGINVTDMNQARSALILISISSGKEPLAIEIDMPDLKDYTKANIQAWAKTNNISVTFKNQASNTIASGKVISQVPKAGTKIMTGSKATITLSTGKGITAVDFTGKPKKEAE